MRTTDDLVKVAAAGGGLEFRAALFSTKDLIRIAAAAATAGPRVQLTIHEMMDRPTEDLVRIAEAGKGCVAFALE
jgi:hypothetical protein